MALESDWFPGSGDSEGYQKQSLDRAMPAVDKSLVAPGPGVSSYARIAKTAFHHISKRMPIFFLMLLKASLEELLRSQTTMVLSRYP